MLDSFEGDLEKTFAELNIRDFKNFIVEVKSRDQEFEPYDPSKICFKIAQWRPNIISLDEENL